MKKGKEWLKEKIADNYIEDEQVLTADGWVTISETVIFDSREEIFNLIDQLDEPKKVVIPKFVSDFITIERYKNTLGNIAEEIYNDNSSNSWSQLSKAVRWMRLNFTAFADAWINSYTIEKEPYWVVKFEATDFYPYLHETGYFTNFMSDDKLKIKPDGVSELNSKDVYEFTEKEKAEAVALLINGAVERVEVTE